MNHTDDHNQSLITQVLQFIRSPVVVIFCLLGIVISSSYSSSSQYHPQFTASLANPQSLGSLPTQPKYNNEVLIINNENVYTLAGYKKVTDYPWQIVEPYRDTYLSLTGGDSSNQYIWTITKEADYASNNFVVTLIGQSVTYQFTATGAYVVEVIEYTTDMEQVNYVKNIYMCKYVRRELRSLFAEDRERYFDAIETMSLVPTEQGQQLFGNNYKDLNWFVREHLYGGADITCDHWHSQSSFMPVHIAFTLQWEKAIQAVDPSVSAHYWDFTIERYYLGKAWRDSLVFQPDWLGDSGPKGGIVTEGRWAYTPVLRNAKSFTSVTNVWNMMKSPWNNDPSPYLTRYGSLFDIIDDNLLGGCDEYWSCLQTTNWDDLSICWGGKAHGRVHQLTGGSVGNIFDDLFALDSLKGSPWTNSTTTVTSFLTKALVMTKLLWRNSYLKCPSSCDDDVELKSDKCQCFCDRNAEIWQDKTAYEILYENEIIYHLYDMDKVGFVKKTQIDGTSFYELDGLDESETEEVWDKLLQGLCKPAYYGQMYEATSSLDVLFWVLHPTMDRLWHWIRLSPYYYGFDEAWIPEASGGCWSGDFGEIPANFSNLFDNTNKVYSNQDLYTQLHPKNKALPYVYDHFTWKHCEEGGYNFSNLNEAWKQSGITNGGEPYPY